MTTPAIEVRDLVKRYRKGTGNAVDGVSFDVEPGQFFALLGPNGAGKTTTIAILTTTLSPTSGTVRICGHDVVGKASSVRSQAGIPQLYVEIADAVIDGDIAVFLVIGSPDDLQIDLESLVELLFLLEFGSLFFELVDVC